MLLKNIQYVIRDLPFFYKFFHVTQPVTGQVIRDHGMPASVMTDRGSRSMQARWSGGDAGGKLGMNLVDLGMCQTLAGVTRHQTSGKLGHLYGKMQCRLHLPGETMMGRAILRTCSCSDTMRPAICHLTGTPRRRRYGVCKNDATQGENRDRKADGEEHHAG